MSQLPKINLIGGYAYSATGGIEAVNRFLISQLVENGALRQAFLLWEDVGALTPEGRGMLEQGWIRGFGFRRVKCALALVWHALRNPGDAWICTHVNYALLGLLLTGWRRKRVLLFIYAAELDDGMTWLKRFALRQVGHLVAISAYSKKKAIKLGVHPERVTVMHLGVADPCPGWTPSTDLNRAPRVLFVGRMDERYKGQMELIDAMALLHRRFPDLKLVFVGGGRNLDEWKQEAMRRELQHVVEFRGRVSDEELARAYTEATVFAMPSHNEGFGLVYVEAMARGLPCIGGERDATCEVIAHGETGSCVAAGNSTAVADAVQALLLSPELRARYGRASRARFVAHFSAVKYAERLHTTVDEWRQALA